MKLIEGWRCVESVPHPPVPYHSRSAFFGDTCVTVTAGGMEVDIIKGGSWCLIPADVLVWLTEVVRLNRS